LLTGDSHFFKDKVKFELKVRNAREFLDKLESRVLEMGDVILLCGGGHSFEMLEATSMIEVK